MEVNESGINKFVVKLKDVTDVQMYKNAWNHSKCLVSKILLSALSADAGTCRLQVGVVCKPIPYYWISSLMVFVSVGWDRV